MRRNTMANEPPDDKTKNASWMRETMQRITGRSEADKIHDNIKNNSVLRDELSKGSSYDHTSSPPNTPNAKKSEDDSARRERTLYERPPSKSR
jgi:hypothetical protein